MPITHTIGIDEVGRGPLAGPLGVGWCMVDADFDMAFFDGIADSKKLSEKKRNEWATRIIAQGQQAQRQRAHGDMSGGRTDDRTPHDRTRSAVMGAASAVTEKATGIASGVVYISAQEIDTCGMAAALARGVACALEESGADAASTQVLLDGTLRAPSAFVHQQSIVKGDTKEPLISAAAIVAKVARDALMVRMHEQYPEYGFAQHKGYGTAAHCAAIRTHGMCPEHRRSFCGNIIPILKNHPEQIT
jgi:ribonuclease HII